MASVGVDEVQQAALVDSRDDVYVQIYHEGEAMQEDSEVSVDFDEHLIMLVQSFPMLWDQALPDFKNKSRREAIWQHIAKKVGLKVEDVTTKWRLLRDKYARELRLQKKIGQRLENSSERQWRYMNRMSFLQQHVKARRKIGRFPLKEGESIQSNDVTPNVAPSTSHVHNNGAKRPRSISLHDDDAHAAQIIAELSETRQTFSGLADRLLAGMPSHQGAVRRIDTLCQLIGDRYMALPPQLQEEFDIEVLCRLKEYGKRAQNAEA